MFLRLYFLLPNEELTHKVISELTESGIKKTIFTQLADINHPTRHYPQPANGNEWI